MSEIWHLLQSGPGAAAENMALDEALLEKVTSCGRPILRFYAWTELAATFGYSQRFKDVAGWTPLRPLIRRPTGGGLVPHAGDWTYSLAFPRSHSWSDLTAIESYCAVHQWIRAAFRVLNVATELAPSERKEVPGQCFAGMERFDLLQNGVKLAGAAQRRNRLGLLIQGSVQPRGSKVRRSDWESAMLHTPPLKEDVQWQPLPADAELTSRVAELAAAKYSQASYNQRR